MQAQAPGRSSRARSRRGAAAAARISAPLVFLRGRDADDHLRELAAARRALRPVLGELAQAFLERRLYHALGYRCLGDWAREKLGLGDRSLRDQARVWKRLCGLPRLRQAVDAGEVPWSVARRVVSLATPENEAAVLESVRGRTHRAVEAMLRAVRGAEDPEAEQDREEKERVPVWIQADARTVGLWHRACEVARRLAGEELPEWACAEAIAAEGATVLGAADLAVSAAPPEPSSAGQRPEEPLEEGRRERLWERLCWKARCSPVPRELAELTRALAEASPRQIARRLERAIAFRQPLELEIGRVLRQLLERKLYRELGFEGFARYVEERLDLSSRTARRLVRLARAEQHAPAVANAFRSGRLTAMQAEALLHVTRGADPESARRWIERAHRVTLRRLEDDVGARPRTSIAFRAPPEVATLLLDVVARAGSLETLLVHVIQTWMREGDHFRDHPTLVRDGYRCTVPACRARRRLESHHIWFRSRGGPDENWNLTTLCWFHHHLGVHEGLVQLRGRAPHALLFEIGGEAFHSGDVRIPLG